MADQTVPGTTITSLASRDDAKAFALSVMRSLGENPSDEKVAHAARQIVAYIERVRFWAAKARGGGADGE